MTAKGDNCFACTKAELLEALAAGQIILWWKFGPLVYDKRGGYPWKELHPRKDTVLRLIEEGVVVPAGEENDVQRQAGMRSFRLAETR